MAHEKTVNGKYKNKKTFSGVEKVFLLMDLFN